MKVRKVWNIEPQKMLDYILEECKKLGKEVDPELMDEISEQIEEEIDEHTKS